MKRDIDIIRSILLAVRDSEGPVMANDIDDVSEAAFVFHAQLLKEAGLVFGKIATDAKGNAVAGVLYRLSWEGHDFADAVENDTI